jgi:SAM-dependent methyltransferase
VDPTEIRQRYGQVFDSVAEEYDRERRSYPPDLVNAALRFGGLGNGESVLEVGSGTGLLTEALVARGLVVDAIDPGAEMVRHARGRLGPDAAVTFTIGRFEDAQLPAGRYAGVFSASAWHWLDPTVSWRRAHETLVPGGCLSLISHFAMSDERTAVHAERLMAVLNDVAPGLAAGWPPPRDAQTLLRGAEERRNDISAMWSWLGHYELRDPAGELFDDVRVRAVPLLIEQTGDELIAYFRTTSLHARLTAGQRERFAAETRRAADDLGGRLRHAVLAVLVSGRRI